ncbi:hypothetical protein N7462_003353 [Penicillium macrosclerotiorum]|uniref:uncharacterized protein n=1 Tax=Penicillium macrosclerotiorum TaxID=303699 RepID=UPI002546AA9D|nr:uncharacterized protein N7462_003353 [Penicillium macrosclerotiorum]KAJ5688961.1 hypothetical protein N7462_003353 [Penicillium macrosclerotiorum]
MTSVRAREDRRCYMCNKTFSKKEHLTRHIRGHTKERPFQCSICGRLYSRSDVLRRHQRNHDDQKEQGFSVASKGELATDSALLTPASAAETSQQLSGISPVSVIDSSSQHAIDSEMSNIAPNNGVSFAPLAAIPGQNEMLGDTRSVSESGTWFLEEDFDVSALDFSITSTISEWAQIPSALPAPNAPVGAQRIFSPVQGSSSEPNTTDSGDESVKRQWFTHMSPTQEPHPSRGSVLSVSNWPSQTNTNESYRAGLSQKLRPRMEDEALPTSEQLNLFAKLYFHRFHPLLPVIHTPSFHPTAENSLLFLSICSIGSLFVGSSHAAMQGERIFERLNKAILASWESFLSQSRPDAFSMVQAAILGQTYAILAGKPKYLVLADVLHGTVVAWAREANRLSSLCQRPHDLSDQNHVEESWQRWIDIEQRARVQVALNIHDAELATLLHHQPIRSHRFRQYPRLESDALFSAPTASRWAILYRQAHQEQSAEMTYPRLPRPADPFPKTALNSRFTAYSILESISARLIDSKQSQEFDHITCQEISNLLIEWWQTYHTSGQDAFCLPVLWHSIFISLYADLDLLEQAIGRDGHKASLEASTPVREWALSFNASRCLLHAALITEYLESMSISSEPAIHVPRALFAAALTYSCVGHYAPKHIVSAEAFTSPEIKLLGDGPSRVAIFQEHIQNLNRPVPIDLDHLYRLIDLLQRGGRWGISQAFANVLSTTLENGNGAYAAG